jgi:hypothetical protein
LHLVVVLAAVEGIEVGDAVDPEDDGLAVQNEALLWFFSAASTIHG